MPCCTWYLITVSVVPVNTCCNCKFPSPRLNKPLSLRAGARQRPSHLDRWESNTVDKVENISEHLYICDIFSLLDELLVRILTYLSSKELMGVARWPVILYSTS